MTINSICPQCRGSYAGSDCTTQIRLQKNSAHVSIREAGRGTIRGKEVVCLCSQLAASSDCTFAMLLIFLAAIFDPELIESIVVEFKDIEEISETSCVQVARMSGQ